MYRLCCDLCERDMSKDKNKTKVTLEDENGYDYEFGHVFRKPRKLSVDICDNCLKLLKEKAKKRNIKQYF